MRRGEVDHETMGSGAVNDVAGTGVDMVLAAARNSPIRSTCLERSLALWWLLAKQSIATQFRIGVRKDGEKFAAHAWVEHDGVAIGEPEASHLHYTVFAEEMFVDAS